MGKKNLIDLRKNPNLHGEKTVSYTRKPLSGLETRAYLKNHLHGKPSTTCKAIPVRAHWDPVLPQPIWSSTGQRRVLDNRATSTYIGGTLFVWKNDAEEIKRTEEKEENISPRHSSSRVPREELRHLQLLLLLAPQLDLLLSYLKTT